MSYQGLTPQIQKNDKTARVLIFTVSFVVFAAVVLLSRVKLDVGLPFDVHVFALINAIINSMVAVLLVAGLMSVKQRKYLSHKKFMSLAILLSVLFLLSYIAHHLLAGDTRYGDLDHDGILSDAELAAAGSMRTVYMAILLTHIPLAGIILPFILFTAYRALTGEYAAHKKLAKITWPVWFYVAVTGVLVYIMIRPYYA
jgi:putative membrane protein